jgi:hypothetical protein
LQEGSLSTSDHANQVNMQLSRVCFNERLDTGLFYYNMNKVAYAYGLAVIVMKKNEKWNLL